MKCLPLKILGAERKMGKMPSYGRHAIQPMYLSISMVMAFIENVFMLDDCG